jgi:hypothetical protein
MRLDSSSWRCDRHGYKGRFSAPSMGGDDLCWAFRDRVGVERVAVWAMNGLGQRSGFLCCAAHDETVSCFGRNDDFFEIEERRSAAAATATAKAKCGDLHCGGKSAASGRDDVSRFLCGYFWGFTLSVGMAAFWRVRESRIVVPRMATMTPSESRGPMSIQGAVSILRAAKARTAARP